MTYVLFDIGGTKTRITTSDDLQTIGSVEKFDTPNRFDSAVEKITTVINKLTDGKVSGIAGGVRGRLQEDRSGIENDAVLTDWAGKDLVGALEEAFDTKVYIENDSAIAGLGEAVFGAGKGMDIVAYHTVSTGVGGAKIEEGKIDQASIGFEPGHQYLDIDRTVLGEDIEPTLENLVSGTALAERFGVPAYEIPQEDVVWDELAEYLAQGLRNTIMYWSPDVIVLGGSMIVGDPAILIEPIRKYTVASLDGFEACPLITKAKLGDEAGLYGAMVLLKQRS
ncbi:ROK family protein [Candidatus Kaiserbacteria bacterium]|nr:ROK family protein [Candidatus Kaiserbacteria bacterium]